MRPARLDKEGQRLLHPNKPMNKSCLSGEYLNSTAKKKHPRVSSALTEIRGSIRKRHLRIPQPEDLEVELITPKSTKGTLCCVGACSSQSLSSCQVPSCPLPPGEPFFENRAYVSACVHLCPPAETRGKTPQKEEKERRRGRVRVSYLGELKKTQKAQSVTTEKE